MAVALVQQKDEEWRYFDIGNPFGMCIGDTLSRYLIGCVFFPGWKEAIAADHVKLVLSPESEPPGCPDSGNDSEVVKTSSDHRRRILGNAENVLANVGPFESKATDAVKAKFRIKPEKSVTIKYIPKQKAIT